MGYLIAGDWSSYQYLVESIRVFPNQVILIYLCHVRNLLEIFVLKEKFASLIKDCGFKNVNYKNMTNGVVAIHTGFKF